MEEPFFIDLEKCYFALLGVSALLLMLFLLGRLTPGLLLGIVLQLCMLFYQILLYVKLYLTGNQNYFYYSASFFAAGVIYLWVMYQCSLSHLSSYPGHPLWSISRLPQTYYLFCGTLPWKIHELHQIFGPVVRVAPNELSYTNLEAWNDIYAKGEDRSQLRKDPGFTPSAATKVRGIKFELDDREHARLRRNLSHGFSTSNIQAQEPIILKYTNKLIEIIKSKGSKPVDVTEMFNFLLFDIAGDMVFGDSFNCLTSSTLHPWIKFIFARVSSSALIGEAAKYWPFSFLFTTLIPKDLIDGDFKHAALAKGSLDKRLAKNDPRTDFTAHLQKSLNKPHGLSYDDLVETTRILIVGGAETTATLLTGLTFYLLSPHTTSTTFTRHFHHSALHKLTNTLRQNFPSASQITVSAIQSDELAYLKACVNEGLRLFPPLPGNLRRIVPKGGKVIAGTWVPGGTRVAVDILSANLSAENFTLPDEYIPERWYCEYREPGMMFEKDQCKVVKPFSHGPRNCIGKNLALMEMQLILAHLLWHFDIELEEESKDWISRVRAIGFFVKPKLMVRFLPAGSRLGCEKAMKKFAKVGERKEGKTEKESVLRWLDGQ